MRVDRGVATDPHLRRLGHNPRQCTPERGVGVHSIHIHIILFRMMSNVDVDPYSTYTKCSIRFTPLDNQSRTDITESERLESEIF
ncbi:MAG: hypothetical protein UY42_C0031G0007 [Parcubacteria group bacterium GW2011_GWA2_49_16]|nr:MAG: hypothetical protein UY42_C0031G0007 [Parcubacteria group bacterium GW2011_GWA2_49_16]